MNSTLSETEYRLKYKDETVLEFNVASGSLRVINEQLLPISLQTMKHTYDMVRKFCSDRVLMHNREYCKEILMSCGVDDQNDISICLAGKGLSFRDNYWISSAKSSQTWKEVNLYENEFSVDISRVALTGEEITGDTICTGELTNKGTRSKCYYRDDGRLYLYKHEKTEEILSEIVTFYIAEALNLPCSKYILARLFDKECSVCEILTSEQIELIPCRDVMSHYNATRMFYAEESYRAFLNYDPINFIKMQLLDYVSLNIDRNRDNFGLLSNNRQIVSLYPMFDHDACFKGKTTNGIYFPTGLSFAKTLEFLKTLPYYQLLVPEINNFKQRISSKQFKQVFLKYKSLEEYDSMLGRTQDL